MTGSLRQTGRRGWPGSCGVLPMLVMMLLLTGCGEGEPGGDSATAEPSGAQRVVATIWPLADVTRQLLPEAVAVDVLLPPGRSPHGFELTPEQMRRLGRAGLLVSVGLSVDTWADDAADRVGGALARWRMAEAALDHAPHAAASASHQGEHGDHGHDHGHNHDHQSPETDSEKHAHDHDHGGVDPHLWLDPVLMRRAAGDLSQHLIERFPEHEQAITRRTADYLQQLRTLDAEYRQRLGAVDQPRIATFHSAFDRLAERYGVEVVATLMPFEPTGEVQLSRIEQVQQIIAAHDLKALFIEPQFADNAARIIQRNTQVDLILLDPIGDPDDAQRDSYLKMMRFNLEQLLRGLSRP